MKRSTWLLGAAFSAAVFGGAMTTNAASLYSQGFETDTSGWETTSGGAQYGTITRVTSGTNGITSPEGSHHAIVQGVTTTDGTNTGPFTRFGGYSSTFGGGWVASLDIYLDTAWADGKGFDYSVSASNNTGGYLRDFIFHIDKDTSTHQLLVNASNNSSDSTASNLNGVAGSQEITSSGWYTFTAAFSDQGGALAGTLSVSDSGGTLFSKTLSDPSDLIANAGGNHYGWFTFIDTDANGVAIDDTQLTAVPLPKAAYAGLGLIAGLGLLGGLKRRQRRLA